MCFLRYLLAFASFYPIPSRCGTLSELSACHQSLGNYPAQMRRVTHLTSEPLSFIAEKDKHGNFSGLTVFTNKSIRFYPSGKGTTRFTEGKPTYKEFYMDILLPSQFNSGIGRTVKLAISDSIEEADFPWNAQIKDPQISFNGESGFNPFSTSKFAEGRDDLNPETLEHIRSILVQSMVQWQHLLSRRNLLANSPNADSELIQWQDKERANFLKALEGCLDSADRKISAVAKDVKRKIEFGAQTIPRNSVVHQAIGGGTH